MEKDKKTIILTGNTITPFQLLKDKAIFIEKEKIVAIKDCEKINSPVNTEIIHTTGGFIVPGFIDIHVHGGGGFDVMDGDYQAVKEVAKVHSRFGTTAFLPTTMTMSKDKILRSLKSIKEAFIKGTSLAPEMPGAIELIRWLKKHNVIASVGHSNAIYKEVQAGIEAGLTHVTHIFNAMRGLNHREPGVVGAALFSPELIVEMIADGIHLHPLAMKLVTSVKDMEKIILITDAMRATSKPEGTYNLGGQEVIVAKGQARLKDGTLAGSVLTLDEAVRNMVNIVGISLIDAVSMTTINPAKCLGIEDKKGSLEPGKDADIVILDKNLKVDMTIVKGRVVYKREKE